MKVAVDLRSLSSGSISGVENYTKNVVEGLLTVDRKNQYVLFYTGLKKPDFQQFQFINSTFKHIRWPNKLLNILLMFKIVKLEKFLGEIDILFMPNLNQFNVEKHVKVVVTVHDLSPIIMPQFYDFKRKVWHKLLNYKNSFARADMLLPVSESTKNDLKKIFNIPDSKLQVVYPATDFLELGEQDMGEAIKSARNRLSLPGRFVLFLNTIEPRKNLSSVLNAFSLLDDDCYLVIAGKRGWKAGKIFKELLQHKKKSKIHYLGYVKESDKQALIAAAEVLIYPSYYEGFGFQVLESFFTKTPVVTSSFSSLPEVAGGGALLINPFDFRQISEAVSRIFLDKELRDNLVKKGRQRAGDFSWRRSAEKICQIFQAMNI